MPSAPKFAIGVEPKQAIEFLRQKKMLASKVLAKEMHDSALARATTIARLTSLDMTKDIYQSLETAMREGKGFYAWKKELVSEFERKGWILGKISLSVALMGIYWQIQTQGNILARRVG